MHSIEWRGNTVQFNRVVAYGCSFTAGSELLDYMLAPHLSESEIDKIKRDKSWTSFYEQHSNPELWNYIRTEQGNHSWAKWFANHFPGAGYINRAVMGSSAQGMVASIEIDLANGNLNDTDLIIVGLTSPDRWLYFDKTGKTETPIFGWSNLWPSEKAQSEFVKHYVNDHFKLYHYYQSMRHLDLLSNKLNGRLLQQYVHHTLADYISFCNEPINPNFLQMIRTGLEFNSVIDQQYSFGHILNWDTDTHGGYHPKLASQKQFGNHIASIVKGVS